jgi:hypothetical protein
MIKLKKYNCKNSTTIFTKEEYYKVSDIDQILNTPDKKEFKEWLLENFPFGLSKTDVEFGKTVWEAAIKHLKRKFGNN